MKPCPQAAPISSFSTVLGGFRVFSSHQSSCSFPYFSRRYAFFSQKRIYFVNKLHTAQHHLLQHISTLRSLYITNYILPGVLNTSLPLRRLRGKTGLIFKIALIPFMIQFTRKSISPCYLVQGNISNYKRKLIGFFNLLLDLNFFFFLSLSSVCSFQILLLGALMTGLMTKESNIPSPLNSGIKADMVLSSLNPRSRQPVRKQCWRSNMLLTMSWDICTSLEC